MARNVLLTLFDDVDTLDFCGPLEVFAITGQRATGPVPFTVTTVAERNSRPSPPAAACESRRITRSRRDPGGHSGRAAAWRAPRKPQSRAARIRPHAGTPGGAVMSVCTGALIRTARAADGLTATTHHGALDELMEAAPKCTAVSGERFVDNGRSSPQPESPPDRHRALWCSVARNAAARETAAHMEYACPVNA